MPWSIRYIVPVVLTILLSVVSPLSTRFHFASALGSTPLPQHDTWGRCQRVSDMAPAAAHIDVLTVTASDIIAMLKNGTTTTLELVQLYFDQIDRHNHEGMKLHAMISLAPREDLLLRAAKLDYERNAGSPRSPLHGVPIIVKDNIMTDAELGMDTTCGSYALKGVKAKANADVVKYILDAGMIILGKTNLSVRKPVMERSLMNFKD